MRTQYINEYQFREIINDIIMEELDRQNLNEGPFGKAISQAFGIPQMRQKLQQTNLYSRGQMAANAVGNKINAVKSNYNFNKELAVLQSARDILNRYVQDGFIKTPNQLDSARIAMGLFDQLKGQLTQQNNRNNAKREDMYNAKQNMLRQRIATNNQNRAQQRQQRQQQRQQQQQQGQQQQQQGQQQQQYANAANTSSMSGGNQITYNN